MSHFVFEQHDVPYAPVFPGQQSGPGLRSEKIEVHKFWFKKGEGAEHHHHPEEQFVLILSGRALITVGDETYECRAGEGSYRPPNVPHSSVCLEDTTSLSFKRLVDDAPDATSSSGH